MSFPIWPLEPSAGPVESQVLREPAAIREKLAASGGNLSPHHCRSPRFEPVLRRLVRSDDAGAGGVVYVATRDGGETPIFGVREDVAFRALCGQHVARRDQGGA